jgi:hypothetical protein
MDALDNLDVYSYDELLEAWQHMLRDLDYDKLSRSVEECMWVHSMVCYVIDRIWEESL